MAPVAPVITVKTFHQSDIRRFTVSSDIGLALLRTTIASVYGLTTEPSFQYIDDEGDLVTVHTENEWREAVRVALAFPTLVLKLFLLPHSSLDNVPSGAEAQQQQQQQQQHSQAVPMIEEVVEAQRAPVPVEKLHEIASELLHSGSIPMQQDEQQEQQQQQANGGEEEGEEGGHPHLSKISRQVLETSLHTSLNLTQTAKTISQFIQSLELTKPFVVSHDEELSSSSSFSSSSSPSSSLDVAPPFTSSPHALQNAHALAQDTLESCRSLSDRIARQCIEYAARIRGQVLEQSSKTITNTPALEDCAKDIDNVHQLADRLVASTRDDCASTSLTTRKVLDSL